MKRRRNYTGQDISQQETDILSQEETIENMPSYDTPQQEEEVILREETVDISREDAGDLSPQDDETLLSVHKNTDDRPTISNSCRGCINLYYRIHLVRSDCKCEGEMA